MTNGFIPITPWPAGAVCPEADYAAFAEALNNASHHFADDSGKEWGAANRCMERAAGIAINARWPYWAMQRMHKEIAPLPRFDDFMQVYCGQLLAERTKGETK
jgi:hypothetical protein